MLAHQVRGMQAPSRGLTRFVVALAALASLLAPAPARAGLVDIQPDPNGPVVEGFFGTLAYTRATGNFHSETNPLTVSAPNIPGGFALFSSGNATVDLTVNSMGQFVSGGAGFTLTGSIDLDGDGTDDVSGTLLTGTITAFGAEDPGPPTREFNGLFKVTGGLLLAPVTLSGGGSLSLGYRLNQPGGFLLFAESVTSGTLGDFSADFSSDSVKGDYVTAIPEPATATLAAVAAGLLAGRLAYRRTKKRRPEG
jgi:hypothetical protein